MLFKTRWDQNWTRLHLLVACADNVNLMGEVINCIRETTKNLCLRPTNAILLHSNNQNVLANQVAISAMLVVAVWIKLHSYTQVHCCCWFFLNTSDCCMEHGTYKTQTLLDIVLSSSTQNSKSFTNSHLNYPRTPISATSQMLLYQPKLHLDFFFFEKLNGALT